MRSLKLTRLLGVVERPQGGYFLANQSCFSPVRVDGPRNEVKAFVDDLNRDGACGLGTEVVDFLASHGILVTPEGEERGVPEWSGDQLRPAHAFEHFTIRLGVPLSDCDGLRESLGALLGQLQAAQQPGKAPGVNVKLIWNASHGQSLGASLSELIGFARAEPSRTAGVTYYGEFPIEVLPDAVGDLKALTRPSLRINCVISGGLSAAQGSALMTLVDEGFRPHCIFRVSAGQREQVAGTIERFANDVGPDPLSIAVVSIDRRDFSSDQAFERALPDPDDMLGLCDFCHSLRNLDLAQSWLYQDVHARVTRPGYAFPCRACLGRAVFVDGERKWSTCHLEAAADPSSRRDDPSALLSGPEPKAFGGSRFAAERCTGCAVRYSCGGVCPYAALGVSDPGLEMRVFELHCAVRKHMILQFFEDATAQVSEGGQEAPAYRFVSGQGRLELQPIGES